MKATKAEQRAEAVRRLKEVQIPMAWINAFRKSDRLLAVSLADEDYYEGHFPKQRLLIDDIHNDDKETYFVVAYFDEKTDEPTRSIFRVSADKARWETERESQIKSLKKLLKRGLKK